MKTIRITRGPLSEGLSTVSGHVTVVEALTAAVQRGIKATDTQTPQLVTSAVYLTLLKRQKTPKPVSELAYVMAGVFMQLLFSRTMQFFLILKRHINYYNNF